MADVTRSQLAMLLDQGAHLGSAEAIRCGEPAVEVLAQVIGRPRYEDYLSDDAVAVFHGVLNGTTTLVED